MACRFALGLACAAVALAAGVPLGAQAPIAPGAQSRVTIDTPRPSVSRGALIGGGAGAAIGAAIGSQSGRSVPLCWFHPCGHNERALAGGIAGGALGAILGAVAGYEAVRDRWQAVLPESFRRRIALSTTGSVRRPTGFKVRIAF